MAPGLRDLHFYTHFDGRSHEPLMAMLAAALGPDTARAIAGKGYLVQSLPDAVLEHPLLDLLGVRYVLATERLAHAGPIVGPTLGDTFFVHERPRALPRAFTVPALAPLPTDAAIVTALADARLEPRRQAFVRTDELPTPLARGDGDRDVHFVTDLPTRIELAVAAGGAPWLVLADTFLPGWSATVDGEAAAIVRVNHSQRAVRLPERACSVTFAYAAPGLGAGLTLAGIATLALALFTLRQRRRDDAGTAP